MGAAERGLAIRTARRDPYDPYLQLGLGAALWADGALARGRKVVAAAARTLGSKDFAPVDRQRALDWLRGHGAHARTTMISDSDSTLRPRFGFPRCSNPQRRRPPPPIGLPPMRGGPAFSGCLILSVLVTPSRTSA